MTDNDEMTDAQLEALAAHLAEIDSDPARANEGNALRDEIAARIRAGFDGFPARVKQAIAQSEKNTRYLKRYLQQGRPKDRWVRFDGAKLREMREALAPKLSRVAFGKKCGNVSDDTVDRWEKGRARTVDFENIVRYLQAEYPDVDVASILLKK
jgi:DNA-binding transcriptional regulator YiaG